MADVRQTRLIEEDLLYNENGDSLREFGAGFHDPEAKRDDLCRKQEMDHRVVVVLLISQLGWKADVGNTR